MGVYSWIHSCKFQISSKLCFILTWDLASFGWLVRGVLPMVNRTAIIKNPLGIHARPAALIVQAAAKFRSEITLLKDGLEVNGKSIMGVMMLAAEPESEVVVKADGEDEVQAVEELVRVIESHFDSAETSS